MAGALSGLVSGLLGVDSPDTSPYGNSALRAQDEQRRLAAREQGNFAQQQGLASQLGQTIAGTAGPSVAQSQLRQGLDQNNASMMAAGAGATGINSVLARYQARQAQGEQAAMMQQQAALLRAQEVAAAQQQLAQLRAAMAGQSIGLYNTNASLGLNYDQLKSGLDQQNAQRDTVLGAAGLSGLSALGASAFSGNGGKSGG